MICRFTAVHIELRQKVDTCEEDGVLYCTNKNISPKAVLSSSSSSSTGTRLLHR